MNKQSFILPIILLTSLSFSLLQARTKVDLEDPVLHLVDGIPGAMDAASLKQCFDTWAVINNVQFKDTYTLGSEKLTFKDIVIREQQYKAKKLSTNSPEYKALLKTLSEVKELFASKTAHLLESAESNAAQEENNKKLVQLWIKKHNRTNSLLASWGTTEETELLEKADTKTFFVFLNDLKYFLEDLMYSCKKARTAFKNECLKQEDHAAFDKFFTN